MTENEMNRTPHVRGILSALTQRDSGLPSSREVHMQEKSIVAGKVGEFPTLGKQQDPPLPIIGACVICGNPIFGNKTIFKDETPLIRRTCNCMEGKTLPETMRTT